MKYITYFYWGATGVFVVFMLFSAFSYLTMDEMRAAFVHLGFPDYFRVQLAFAKILGALALLLPFVPKSFKLFAYAGFTINIFSGAFAHLAVGDGFSSLGLIIISAILLLSSYFSFYKLSTIKA